MMSNTYNPLENSQSFQDETISPTQSLTNRSSGIFTQTPASSYQSGNVSTGLNDAQNTGISTAIGSAAQIGSTVIQGVATANQNEENRATARQIAGQNREDTLKQQNIDNTLRAKQQEIERKTFNLKKEKDDYDLKINSFLYSVKKDIDNRQKLTSNVDELFGSMAQNEQIKNLIVGFAKGNV